MSLYKKHLKIYESSFPTPTTQGFHGADPKYNFPLEWIERAGLAKGRATRWHNSTGLSVKKPRQKLYGRRGPSRNFPIFPPNSEC
jgi:hypothetical protein